MAGRIALLTLALLVAGYGVHRQRQVDRCATATEEAFAIAKRQAPVAGAERVADSALANCRNGKALVSIAAAIAYAGAEETGVELAREAVARDPDRRDAWLGLAYVLERTGDRSGSAAAFSRVRSLDPRGSLKRSNGRSTR